MGLARIRALPLLGRGTRPPPTRVGACANCGAAVDGAFCAACGQETRLALPTARTFLHDALGRYVALDSRMWRTLAFLLVRPGFLTREYLAGRRLRYVRPGRLLLVLALALFAALRFTASAGDMVIFDHPPADADRPAGKAASAGAHAPAAETPSNVTIDDDLNISLGTEYPWLAPVRERLKAFNRLSREQKSTQLFQGVLRYGPYAFIGLLPFFAGLMQLAYLGRTRRHPARPDRYAAHLVFGAHSHAFVALTLLLILLVPVTLVRVALWLWLVAYLPRSVKAVYGGPWWGVLLRTFVIAVAYLFVFAFAVAALFLAAVLLR